MYVPGPGALAGLVYQLRATTKYCKTHLTVNYGLPNGESRRGRLRLEFIE